MNWAKLDLHMLLITQAYVPFVMLMTCGFGTVQDHTGVDRGAHSPSTASSRPSNVLQPHSSSAAPTRCQFYMH